jgi:hypothetical protein
MKGGIYMNKNIEGSAALLLSVCYGIKPDVAIKLTRTQERRLLTQEEIISHEIEKFFGDRYDFMREVFLYHIDHDQNVDKTAKKFDITNKTVRSYLASFEEHYLEFKGLIELGRLDYYDHEKLFPFLTRYGAFYVKEQEKMKTNYRTYLRYLNGEIDLKRLKFITHMTPKTLAEI